MTILFDELRDDPDMHDFEYRHAFADADLNAIIAMQIKAIREQRGLTQTQLANATGMAQPRISILEDVNYSAWSIATLKRLARAFDVRLKVRFEEFGTFENDLAQGPEDLQCRKFEDDPKFAPVGVQVDIEPPDISVAQALHDGANAEARSVHYWDDIGDPKVTSPVRETTVVATDHENHDVTEPVTV